METEELILKFKLLADKCAWSFIKKTPKSVYFEDLQSAAYLGLIEAAHRYEPAKGQFFFYARSYIIGSIKEYLRNLWKHPCLSLDEENDNGSCLADVLYDKHKECFIQDALENLNDIEKKAILMYYVDGYNLVEIGLELGVKKARVSQILSGTRDKIKRLVA